MSIKGRLRRLEQASKEELIAIPQIDGTVARFTQRDYRDAFLCAIDRVGAGEAAPERHPMLVAMRSSSDPRWRDHLADLDDPAITNPVEDLSTKPNG